MSGRIFAVCLVSAVLLAQTPPPQVIRVTTRLVEVNAVVRDRGKVVGDLTRDDFTLLDNGKPQKIAVFSTSQVGAVFTPPGALPPNVFTNIPGRQGAMPHNATVVLMDGLNTPLFDKPYAREQLAQFLKQLHPEDRVAVYALGRKLVVLNDFSNDSRRLLDAVNHYKDENLGVAEATNANSPDYGAAPADASHGGVQDAGITGLQAALQDANRAAADFATLSAAEITTAALEAIADHVAALPGRKNLVWITSAIPMKIDQAMRLNKNQAADRELMGEQTFRAVKALNDADIAVYPVDARGLITGPATNPLQRMTVQQALQGGFSTSAMGISASQDSLIGLAAATGGQAFYNSNDIDGAIRKAIDDAEFTYTLGFYPESGGADSSFHELKVKVNGKNYEIRCRNGYRASPDAPADDQEREKLIRDALWSPLASSGIEMAVRAEKTDAPKAGSLKVTVAVDARQFALQSKEGKWEGAIDYVIAQRAANGRFLNRKAKGVALNLDAEQYKRLEAEGLTLSDTGDLLAGAAEIRIVLLDRTSGHIGSVIVPVK